MAKESIKGDETRSGKYVNVISPGYQVLLKEGKRIIQSNGREIVEGNMLAQFGPHDPGQGDDTVGFIDLTATHEIKSGKFTLAELCDAMEAQDDYNPRAVVRYENWLAALEKLRARRADNANFQDEKLEILSGRQAKAGV